MTEDMLLEGDRKLNVMFCAQVLDAYPRLIVRKEKRTRSMKESISAIFGGYGGDEGSEFKGERFSIIKRSKRPFKK